MKITNTSKWIAIVGTLTIWTIKWGIRPYVPQSGLLNYFLGIAPNLLGSFCLLFGVVWLLPKQLSSFLKIYSVSYLQYFFFALLVFNELLQLIPIFGRTFDFMDILCSGIGLYASLLYYRSAQPYKELELVGS